ncbi:MAG: hypothetical protein IPM29_01175 [Planctomycetes bacterium]|nr:hypothetical protein [Planctomycetota bacterium]
MMHAILRASCLASLAVGLLAGPALGQGDVEDLVKKRDEKMKSEWLQQASWTTDYDAARAQAKETGKVIFAYFTRSYSP